MAKLSQTEKYAIQGMLHEQMSIADIAIKLQRTEKTIKKYVSGELEDLQNTIVRVQLERQESQARIEAQKEYIQALEKQIPTPPDPRELVKAKNQIIKTTGMNKKGVAIMTESGSTRGDETRKKIGKYVSRKSSKNLYRISDKKILKEGDSIDVE